MFAAVVAARDNYVEDRLLHYSKEAALNFVNTLKERSRHAYRNAQPRRVTEQESA
jgi:hypothetical protein